MKNNLLTSRLHYKDAEPIDTILRIKNILKELEIDIEETWFNNDDIDIYSLRIVIKGTEIGTNGKGVTKELALASAYGEFLERLQNDYLLKNLINNHESNFIIANDEKLLSAEELIKDNNIFINKYFEERNMQNDNMEVKVSAFEKVNVSSVDDGKYCSLPFYDVFNDRICYIPDNTQNFLTGSNGMAAGNTPEEALVEGISEIFERYVQKQLFYLQSGLPDIPEDYLSHYEKIYKMFKKLNDNQDFIVYLKDCSFGGQFPVVALIIIHKDTGNYGVKLGCHPVYQVALERTFTEAAQGMEILNYSNRSKIDFTNKDVTHWSNKLNTFKDGYGQYPYQILSNNSDFSFCAMPDMSDKNNKELLEYLLDLIKKLKFDILIRDVSYLGFPSYKILIPGMSEIFPNEDSIFKGLNSRVHLTNLLLNPEYIDPLNSKIINSTLCYFSKCSFYNTLSSYFDKYNCEHVPYNNIGCGILYLSAMCHVINKKYKQAAAIIEQIENGIKMLSNSKDEKIYMNALKNYLYCLDNCDDHLYAMEYIERFYNDKISNKINNIFKDKSKIFVNQYDGIWKEIHKNINPHTIRNIIIKKEQNTISQQNLSALFY